MFFRLLFITSLIVPTTLYSQSKENEMVKIKGGIFSPFYGGDTVKAVIKDFQLDVYPVTNEEYSKFLKDYPKWKRGEVIALFADKNYLTQFNEDGTLKSEVEPNAAVNNVSWFAAKEYCKCQGKRLPTIDEWEYVAAADETTKDARKKDSYTTYILSWYEKRNSFQEPVGSTFKNFWGVYDMHGLLWEWTADFNSVLVSSNNRGSGDLKNQFVCGGASVNTTDPSDYAAFMRYAFRASLKGNYAMKNLGFRCAK